MASNYYLHLELNDKKPLKLVHTLLLGTHLSDLYFKVPTYFIT